MKTPFCLLLTVLLFALCGCGKDPLNELPPATQIGANTFGCKVNGVVYKTSGPWKWNMIWFAEGVKAEYRYGEMTIVADCIRPNRGRVGFIFKYDGGIGKYTDIRYIHKHSKSYVNITKFGNGIISGTFNIVEVEDEVIGEEPVLTYYTDGRFDIQTNTGIFD